MKWLRRRGAWSQKRDTLKQHVVAAGRKTTHYAASQPSSRKVGQVRMLEMLTLGRSPHLVSLPPQFACRNGREAILDGSI